MCKASLTGAMKPVSLLFYHPTYTHSPASNVVVVVVVNNFKHHLEPPWEGVTKVRINGLGHMTKMAATPINVYRKTFFSGTGSHIIFILDMQH